jgi:hypothetical protein
MAQCPKMMVASFFGPTAHDENAAPMGAIGAKVNPGCPGCWDY